MNVARSVTFVVKTVRCAARSRADMRFDLPALLTPAEGGAPVAIARMSDCWIALADPSAALPDRAMLHLPETRLAIEFGAAGDGGVAYRLSDPGDADRLDAALYSTPWRRRLLMRHVAFDTPLQWLGRLAAPWRRRPDRAEWTPALVSSTTGVWDYALTRKSAASTGQDMASIDLVAFGDGASAPPSKLWRPSEPAPQVLRLGDPAGAAEPAGLGGLVMRRFHARLAPDAVRASSARTVAPARPPSRLAPLVARRRPSRKGAVVASDAGRR
jgi:hypothetical protein